MQKIMGLGLQALFRSCRENTKSVTIRRFGVAVSVRFTAGPANIPGRRSRVPHGFTRVIREFHEMIKSIEATHLTDADRGALRALFRDLTMLARASTTRQSPVFPPLPASEPRRAPSTRSRK